MLLKLANNISNRIIRPLVIIKFLLASETSIFSSFNLFVLRTRSPTESACVSIDNCYHKME